MPNTPTIPQTITVHLGAPNESAENVTIPFLDYVSNVASSEIYPNWPENAIRANIYAQISFALNRVYTEYYRTRGFDFDITNSTSSDQSFVNGRDIFENIRQIVGEIFDSYIRRENSVQPLFAQYCNGTTVTCQGLSQWGSVELAEQGYTPFEILQYYYGDDIELVRDVPIAEPIPSAPNTPLRIGNVNNDVRTVQIRLNRISANYPSIPKIPVTDGIFGTDTEAAVKRFQEIFGLTPDGVVGKATWYTIQNIYIGVKRLTDLSAEAIRFDEISQQFPEILQEGDVGISVANLQYYLDFLSVYYNVIPPLEADGVFGSTTRSAVESAQRAFGLPVDGVVGETTWNAIYNAYLGIARTVPLQYTEGVIIPYQGVVLRIGADSEEVRLLQEYLNYIARTYPAIPTVTPTGYFGPRTQEAVLAFQNEFGLEPTGTVGAITWQEITDQYETLFLGSQLQEGQYPGYEIGR